MRTMLHLAIGVALAVLAAGLSRADLAVGQHAPVAIDEPEVRIPGAAMQFAHEPMKASTLVGDQPAIEGLTFFDDPRPEPSFGFGKERWWALMDLAAASGAPETRYVAVDAPSSDVILAFLRCNDEPWRALPRAKVRYAVFETRLEAPRCTLLIMEETRSVVRFQISVLSATAIVAPADQTLIGLVLGTSMAAVLFVLFLWIATRRPEFLHFIAYQIAAGIVILRIWGYAPSLILTGEPHLAAFLGVAGLNLWILEYFNYVRGSLRFKTSHRSLDRVMTLLMSGVWIAILGEAFQRHFPWPLTLFNMAAGLTAYITVVIMKFRTERTRAIQQILGYAPTIVCFGIYLITLTGYAKLADLRALFLLGQIGSTLALSLWMAQAFQRDRDRRESDLAATVVELQANRNELERYQNDLETMVQDRTDELRRALQAEREIVTQQHDFAVMVGHEFRTPLAVIDGQARQIARASNGGAEDDLVRRSREIREAVGGMIELMNGLLNHARGDDGWNNINFSTAQLHKIVERAAANAIPAERAPDLRFDVPAGIDCRADPVLLATAIGNVLSNAAKYSTRGTPIEIGCAVRDGMIELTIRDYGMGIAPGEFETVFARFQRGSNALTTVGAGIGLHVAQQIIEQHGGKITVSSNLGEGARFVVTLAALPLRLADESSRGDSGNRSKV